MKTNNNNQNFLNALDDWGSILTDTYDNATKPHVTVKENNVNVRLNTNPIEADTLGKSNYYEEYLSLDETKLLTLNIQQVPRGSAFDSFLNFQIALSQHPFTYKGHIASDHITIGLTDNYTKAFGKPNTKQSNISIDHNILNTFFKNAENSNIQINKDEFNKLKELIKIKFTDVDVN